MSKLQMLSKYKVRNEEVRRISRKHNLRCHNLYE